MFDKWLKLPAHYWLRITALVILLVGISVSNVLMSIGAIWIISNWLIEGKFREYGMRIRQNPALILILVFLLFSLLSVLWSDDFWYAFHDMRIKLPLLAIPLALGSGDPLERKVLRTLLFLFIGVVTLISVINFIWFNYYSNSVDIRQMSWFISQIRFATLVDLALFTTVFLLLEKSLRGLLAIPIMLWFTIYTFYAQVINGYVLFAILFVFTGIYLFIQMKKGGLKVLVLVASLAVIFAISLYLFSIFNSYKGLDRVNYAELDHFTENGNPYYHDTLNLQTENGHYVWLYVAVDELRSQWNNRSKIAYDSIDQKGQPMFGTVLRYMTSKNLRKDSAGVWSLTEDEILRIEEGCTGINMNKGLEAKVHAFLFEYDMYRDGADPNGFSLLQRIEHLRIAKAILADFWLTGVGIGDVNQIFQDYYVQEHTLLNPDNRLRSHNQFLTNWIALGLFGLFITILIFVVPVFTASLRDYFMGIVILSLSVAFLFEDMLETQAGATIFALFYSLAVFRSPQKNQS
jgi:hypothetical protein